MTEAMSELHALVEYYSVNRRRGHTTALLEGAIVTQALVVALDESHAQQLRQSGVNAINRHNLASELRGRRVPLLIDHATLCQIILDAERKLDIELRLARND